MQRNEPLVAICIPTADLGYHSLDYLEACLSSIEDQDYPNIRVIISDHSPNNKIEGYLGDAWSDYDRRRPFDLVYTKFEEGRGTETAAVRNTNNAIDQTPDGCLVKLLFQDDLLKTRVAISRMVSAIGDHNWVAVACNHIDEGGQDIDYNHVPAWVPGFQLPYGLNRIGSPSVVMFRKCEHRMDPELSYLNDCEFYYRLGMRYGPPALIRDMLVSIRMRADSLSNARPIDEIKAREQRYVQRKYGVTNA